MPTLFAGESHIERSGEKQKSIGKKKIDITQITLCEEAGQALMFASKNVGLVGENVGLF